MLTFRSTTIVLLAALIGSSCGSGTAVSPDSSSPTVALIPVPTGPTVAATPAPTIAKNSCDRIGYGTAKAQCGPSAPLLLGEMSTAIDRLVAKRPDLFEEGSVAPWGDPRAIDQDRYYAALLAELDSMGVCAQQKENSMVVSVKTSNEWSEDYQPLTSKRFPWRGKGSYLSGCSPASFPRAPIDHIDYMFVTAYGFACHPESSVSLTTRGSRPAFPVTCDAHVTATPKTYDNVDVPKDVHGSEIEWELVEGKASFEQWGWQPFNLTVFPQAPGPIKICATVQGVRGCLSGQILEKPATK